MLTLALELMLLMLAFIAGAWLMFTSLTPRPGLETYCAKCANNLTGLPTEYCPKCRRMLDPDMTVTCTRSAIRPGRLLAGFFFVMVAAVIASLKLQ